MVNIIRKGTDIIFEVKGIHKLWAFKSQVTIPADHIKAAYRFTESSDQWKGWRMPGTFIPSVITAGTFYKDHEKDFWDTTNTNNCIVESLQMSSITSLS